MHAAANTSVGQCTPSTRREKRQVHKIAVNSANSRAARQFASAVWELHLFLRGKNQRPIHKSPFIAGLGLANHQDVATTRRDVIAGPEIR